MLTLLLVPSYCYALLQAMLCNRTTTAEACSALSFCRRSSSGLCTPRLYAQDNFGSSVQEYMVGGATSLISVGLVSICVVELQQIAWL
jgi:hypothetical protein